MDAALRRLQRDGDLAREAIIETRVGGGVAGWLASNPGDQALHYSEEAALLTACNLLDPVIELHEEARTNWVGVIGATRFVFTTRVERLVLVSLTPFGYPVMIDWMETQTRILRPEDVSYGAFDVRTGRPKSTIRDKYAREAYDAMLRRVRSWAVKLEKLQGVPATAFTLEQTRVYRGLDPYGR